MLQWDLIWKILWGSEKKKSESYVQVFWNPQRQLGLTQAVAPNIDPGKERSSVPVDLYIREIRIGSTSLGRWTCYSMHQAGRKHRCGRVDADVRRRRSSGWMFKCEEYEESMLIWDRHETEGRSNMETMR
jgi:hypothetical protein